MIDLLKELLKEFNQDFSVRYDDETNFSITLKSNGDTYRVIGELLHAHGIKGEGRCNGGFEIYPMDNGMTFAVAWNPEGLDKMYLGKMGTAF
jgi:hypothetical protein